MTIRLLLLLEVIAKLDLARLLLLLVVNLVNFLDLSC